ncbi:hypothetical protein A9199_13120 [Donghicola sp. JL3646]|jgi:hypothetical protein|nr:hypothetical protein BSK21_12825 [Marivivens sp. JLT3646]NVJ94305.1 hypothetical protein [Marivivens sp.]OBR38555.1 hypothetical protein A9199_13120 [Donghicola sp. JL3646]
MVVPRQKGHSGRMNLIDKFMMRRLMRYLAQMVKDAKTSKLDLVRRRLFSALEVRARMDEFIYVANERLALPMIGANRFPTPRGTDWAWRPQLWRGPLGVKGMASAPSKTMIGDEVTLYHDCQISELTLRQLRNTREADLAPYGLRMDVFKFDGTYLSLAIDFPDEACHGLTMKHLVRCDPIIETEKPLEIFARLNIKHGPNVEQIVRELPLGASSQMVEFDLGYSKLNEKRIEKVWMDLIFEGPSMNQVTVRDLTLCRYPRAEF